jgi:hypothetical protein
MRNANEITEAPNDFVFAKAGEVYAVYLPDGGSTEIDLSAADGAFEVRWYDPRHGGDLQNGSVSAIRGGGNRPLGNPPNEPAKDWAVLVRRAATATPAVSGQTLDGPTPFLVKLGVDLGSATSRVGDAVTAVVISPERFLGAGFEGTVDQVSGGTGRTLRFTFHRLMHKENTYRVTSAVTGFVNSLGHRSVDESERPVQLSDGVLTAPSADFTLNEGAEFQLQVTPAPD